MASSQLAELRQEVDRNRLWYHTLDLGNGVVTPGWMDLRPVVERLPWPDVRGKRCLDVGTYAGFFAFELERRGAAEVVATDISEHSQWDWSWAMRGRGAEFLASVAGEKGRGFEIAHAALGSAVVKRELSVYELSPDAVGEFEVVVCGSLMLHLKSPVRAMEAIRSVCRGAFLSAEQIDPLLSLVSPRRPASWFRAGHETQWQIPNVAGLRALVESAGFRVERSVKPYAVPFGAGYRGGGARGVRSGTHALLTQLVAHGSGVPHAAVLASAA
ncbi:MAG: tRNA (mo5U34)-methyltransferase [Thermoleophilaceae bacterium]|nr:tRNA (mo5U34)-methyltransferase [Thermoleophilaceae bacterium]